MINDNACKNVVWARSRYISNKKARTSDDYVLMLGFIQGYLSLKLLVILDLF